MQGTHFRHARLLTSLALLASVLARPAFGADVQQVIQSALPNVPGKDLTIITVSYAPGAKSQPHRHGQAFLYAYVLEGSVRSQVEGEAVHVYEAGEGWSESPGAHHVVSENASDSAPAKFLVVFVADPKSELSTTDK